MKKFNLLLFVFTMVATGLYAQINIVPKVGLNLLEFKDDDLSNVALDGSIGYNVGVDLRIGEDFIFRPGIHYYNLNADFAGTDGGGIDEVFEDGSFRSESIRIPVMIGGGLGENESFQIRALVGGVAAFRMKVNSDEADFFNTKDNFRPAVFGAMGSIGFDFGSLALGISYELGLSDVLENGEGSKNNIATLTLGYVL